MKIRKIIAPFFALFIMISLTAMCFAVSWSSTATPSADQTMLNGSPVTMQAYKISEANYVKLRDFAQLINGTPLNFEVTWDSGLKAINMYTEKPYTPVGGEGAAIGSEELMAKHAECAIYVNGQPVNLNGYNIHGNNYFKLRDLGAALGITVDWNNETKTVTINSMEPPAPPEPEGIYELSAEEEALLQETLDWIGRDDPFAKRVEAGWRTTLSPEDPRHPGWDERPNFTGNFFVATLRPGQEGPKNAERYDAFCAGGKSSWDGITVN